MKRYLILGFVLGGMMIGFSGAGILSYVLYAPAPEPMVEGSWDYGTLEPELWEPQNSGMSRDGVYVSYAERLEERVSALEADVEKLSELALMQSDLILKLTLMLTEAEANPTYAPATL